MCYEERVGGGMIESSRMGILEKDGMEGTKIMGGVVIGRGVIGENKLPSEGILKEKGEPMIGGVATLRPTKDEMVILELEIELVGEMRELLVIVAYMGGNWTLVDLVGNPFHNFFLIVSSISFGSSSPILVSSVFLGRKCLGPPRCISS